MPNCPVCETEYNREIPEFCTVCGWELTPQLLIPDLPETYHEREDAKLNWAKQMWRANTNRNGINSQTKPGIKSDRPPKQKPKNRPKNPKNVQKRLDLLEAKLEEATKERSEIQSQLEWVLYRLEQLNPEFLQETLARIEEGINALPTAEPAMSEVGMDYNPLINLLAAGKWRKADELTWELILKVVVRDEEGWLRLEDIDRFPCTDLSTIDWAWDYYSNGLFGLRVQQQIWEGGGGDYSYFCDRVGWRERDNWKYYDELRFNLQAPQGHLPAIFWRRRACYGVGKMTAAESFAAFASRLLLCGGDSQEL
jgi:hypothetical protein